MPVANTKGKWLGYANLSLEAVPCRNKCDEHTDGSQLRREWQVQVPFTNLPHSLE